jgi:hypothetical protein
LAGASAVQQVLLEHPNEKLTVLAVWEPVLVFDLGAPASAKLARLSDPRVEQFWDPGRLLSQRLLGEAHAHPERLNPKQRQQLAHAKIVWDFIALFSPRAYWQSDPPWPTYSGAPVVQAIAGLRQQLRSAQRH